MESDSFKAKPHHIKPRQFANDSTTSPANMGAPSELKTKKHSSVDNNFGPDKENSNPNRKAHKTKGGSQKTIYSDEMYRLKVNDDTDGGSVPEDATTKHHKQVDVVKSTPSYHHSSDSKLPVPQGYIDAITRLNTLQSNARAVKDSRVQRDSSETKAVQVDQVLHYLGHLNVTVDDISKLHFIHISGTKGKGSTSAYCESILRAHGFTTGFFSSPHLIEVRERIKLNGKPICYEKFTKYFWTVYNALHANRRNPDDMPAYFKFLTVMSFYIFVKEKPDVCIVEVGIGGLYDNTNIIPNPDVVGITSLGFDHTAVLGNTIEQIAAQKAGIIKKGSMVVTAADQFDECNQVLLDKAEELGCTILEAPHIWYYEWKNQPLEDEWHTTFQAINISLAIQLAFLFMHRMKREGKFKDEIDQMLEIIEAQNQYERVHGTENPYPKYTAPPFIPQACHFDIDPVTYRGIKECDWPGRVQILHKKNFTYFLDGAHTNESIRLCAKWFHWKSIDIITPDHLKTPIDNERVVTGMDYMDEMSQELKGYPEPEDKTVRILVFNVTGDRDPVTLLKPLLKYNKFHYILVTPIVVSNSTCPDVQYGGNRTVDRYGVKAVLQHHKDDHRTASHSKSCSVDQLTDSIRSLNTPDSINHTTTLVEKLTAVQKIVNATRASKTHNHTKVIQFDSVLDTYNFKHSLDPSSEYHVLVTGSLHLVGAFLNVLTNFK